MSSNSEYDIEVLFEGSGDIIADVIFVHGLTGGRRSTWTTATASNPTETIPNTTVPTPDPTAVAAEPASLIPERAAAPPEPAKKQASKRFRNFFGIPSEKSGGETKGKSKELKKEKTVCWPEKFLPSDLKNACRIMTWGYDADVAHIFRPAGTNTILQHGKNLLVDIERHRESEVERTRPIIFVCHSLGGIIVKDALEQSKKSYIEHLQPIFKACHGVIFLGTPHRGAGKATVGAIATGALKTLLHDSNSSLVRDLEVNSETLDRISEDFSRMLKRNEVKVFSFWEELGLTSMIGIGLVVEPFSAILGDPEEGKASIHGNHITMTKFSTEKDPGYQRVSREIRRFVEEAARIPDKTFASARRGAHHSIVQCNPSGRMPSPMLEEQNIIMLPFEQSTYFKWRPECGSVDHMFKLSTRPIVVLTGLGGAGKTFIAGAYATMWVQQRLGSVFWINADTLDTIEKDIIRITMKMTESGSASEQQNLAHSPAEQVITFHNWLSRRDKWLLIFDNADNIKLDLKQYLPPNRSGYILFTSRDTRLVSQLNLARQVKVEALQDNEALDMFLAICSRDDIKAEFVHRQQVAAEIVQQLENFPLAISQAASFLRWHKSFSGADYLSFLQDKADRLKLLSFSSGYENFNRTVMTTWEISFKSLIDDPQTSRAADLLSVLGFLDPAGVSEEFLASAFETKHGVLRQTKNSSGSFAFLRPNFDFRLYVDVLVALSLVTRTTDYRGTGFLMLHPLVHEWTRVRLSHGESGRAIHSNLFGLSSALALHNVDIIVEWRNSMNFHKAKTSAGYAFLQIRQITLTSDKYGIEPFLLMGSAVLYRRQKSRYLNARSYDRHRGWQEQSEALLSMLQEYWYPAWDESDAILSILDDIGQDDIESDLQKYSDCLLAGLQCLRSLVKATEKYLTTTIVTEIDPRLRPYSKDDANLAKSSDLQDKLAVSLEKLWQHDAVSQQFKTWAETHDNLHPLSEDDLQYSWYSHFRHVRCLLVAAINGLLWPKYLTLQHPWSANIDAPQSVTEAFFALDEQVSAKCWAWEYRDPLYTHSIAEDSVERLVQVKFAHLYEGSRLEEAEEMLQKHAARYQHEGNEEPITHEQRLTYVETIAECMRQRKDYEACTKILISSVNMESKYDSLQYRGVENAICRLSTHLTDSQSLYSLHDAEDVLVLFIVVVLSGHLASGESWPGGPFDLSAMLGEVNPAGSSGLALGEAYSKSSRYLEAAILISWALEYWGGRTPREPVKTLIRCLESLEALDEQTSSALVAEADKEKAVRKRAPAQGPYAVLRDQRFEDARIKMREMERAAGSVKTRFFECLRRMGREDKSENVDVIWETMLTKKWLL